MQKSIYNKVMKIALFVFVAFQLLLFPQIQLTTAYVSRISSYCAIALVVLFAFLCYRGLPGVWFIRVGLVFTLVADTFLLLCKDADLNGVLTFIVVQMAYFVYLVVSEERSTLRHANILTRLIISLILLMVVFAVLGDGADTLSIASVIYYGNLVTNTVFAFARGRKERWFAWGLLLFCMCDLCIGFETLFSSYLGSNALDFFYSDTLNLPWVFYHPSQVLIGISLYFQATKGAE